MIGDFPPPSQNPNIGQMDAMIMQVRNGLRRGIVLIALMDDEQPLATNTALIAHGVRSNDAAYLMTRAFALTEPGIRAAVIQTAQSRGL